MQPWRESIFEHAAAGTERVPFCACSLLVTESRILFDPDRVADLLLLRELVHHGRLPRIVLESAGQPALHCEIEGDRT